MKKLLKNDGIVFVAATAMMFLLLSLGVAYMTFVRSDIEISRNEIDALRALYYAESGTEHFLARLRNGDHTWGDPWAEAWGDVDEDAQTDYWTNINWTSKTLKSLYMPPPDVNVARTTQVNIYPNNVIQVDGKIDTVMSTFGTISGDVDAVGTIHGNLTSLLVDEDVYKVTPNNTSLVIPVPNFTEYANPANFTDHHAHSDCTFATSNIPASLTLADGVHYVNGDCAINGTTNGPFVLNGTLVVSGNLSLSQITGGVTINPTGNNPAVVVGGNFTATALNSVRFGNNTDYNGLVYAGGNMSWTTFAFSTQVYGPMMVGGIAPTGGILDLVNVASITQEFDPKVEFPYFTGGGGGTILASGWKGHEK